MVIDGKRIAEDVIAKLKARPVPTRYLVAVVVGDDPASASFVGQKERVAKELGVDFRIEKLDADSAESALISTLKNLGEDESCGGIILQLPLPAHLNRDRVIAAIPPEKDVDVLRGEGATLPPAIGVVQEILKIENCKIENSTVAVVGIGFLVGQPITKWLKGSANSHELANGKVRVKELVTLDINDDLVELKKADVVILGAGKAGLVRPEMLKSGALVIDFGYSRGADGKLRGDLDSSLLTTHHSLPTISYTPTPGGTGPILVAKLFENFYRLNGEM